MTATEKKGSRKFPSVYLSFPSDPFISDSRSARQILESLMLVAEEQLFDEFPAEYAWTVALEIRSLARKIDWKHLPKGVAFYASIKDARLFRFSFPINENIIVKESTVNSLCHLQK